MTRSEGNWFLVMLAFALFVLFLGWYGMNDSQLMNCRRDVKAFAMCKQDQQCKITTRDMRTYNWCMEKLK